MQRVDRIWGPLPGTFSNASCDPATDVPLSSGTQPSLPAPRSNKQPPRSKAAHTLSAPKLRGYRAPEALDRRILDFRGIVSCRRMVGHLQGLHHSAD
jgi:hypothetical protein